MSSNSSPLLGSARREATCSSFQTSILTTIGSSSMLLFAAFFCLLFFSSFDSCFTFSLCNSGKPFVNFYLFFLFLSLSFSFKISLFFSRYLFCFSAFESFFSQAGFLPILLACNTISLTQTHFLFTCSTCSRSLCCTMLTFTRK